MSLLDKVRALLGGDAVLEGPASGEVPRVAPPTPDAVALLLGTAHEEGWRVRVEGTGSWLPPDAPADLTLTTRRLDRVTAVEPQDLVATAEAGIGWDALRQQLADRGAWLALDPPGVAGRSLGSVVATGTAGAFGAFGVIVLVHLRLRALPRADETLVLEGPAEELLAAADEIRAAELAPAALELLSPALARRERWVLAARLVGSPAAVAADEGDLRALAGGRFAPLRAEEAHAFWSRAAEAFALRPVTFRVGGLPEGGEELLDLVRHQLSDEWVSAAPGVGSIRWAGDATADRLRRLRRALAALEVPLTLERAPWALRSTVGHFGAYREGVGPLVSGLRHTFDPKGTIVTAVEGDE